ncbi:hypothetical protein FGO68_gene15086 [Halteria grandinella]|uniref:Uncharacterized protein n=1 Tax=Halteria grandinella TaxID=5974 RepID=A0A8J8NUW0_HALGN|nr:hypothetical protein FGO68_gene15086 [Halteria grandinella]
MINSFFLFTLYYYLSLLFYCQMEQSRHSTHKLMITNKSGTSQYISLFQAYSNIGYPVVWEKICLGPENSGKVEWSVNWGLRWETAEVEISPDVKFNSAGEIQVVHPMHREMNSIKVSIENGDFISRKECRPELAYGQLGITTTDFSEKYAKDLQFSICMESKPVYVMKGRPNQTLVINASPKFYIGITEAKVGAKFDISNAKSVADIKFSDANEAECVLDEKLNFIFK